MPNVYVEARPKGRSEGSAIADYVRGGSRRPRASHLQNTAGGNRMVQKKRTRPAGRRVRH